MAKKSAIDKSRELLEQLKKAPKHIAPVQKKHGSVIKQYAKMGRPTEKDFDRFEYVKLSARVPEQTREKLKVFLATSKKYRTQDEFINEAILKHLSNQK